MQTVYDTPLRQNGTHSQTACAFRCCDGNAVTPSHAHQLGDPSLATYPTKSRYMAGLQCQRRLWLRVHDPEPYEEPASGSPLDIGQQIGRKA